MRVRNALLPILLIALALVATPAGAQDRDPLAPVSGMEAPQFEAFPPDAVAEENAEAITALVNEARLFGVPVAVRVVDLPIDHTALSGFSDLDPSSPIAEETVREMAQAWMSYEPIESAPGADDGFLMFVVIPDDPTLSVAVFEWGSNALPLNGLTQENVDAVIDDLVMPRFAADEISQGIRLGLSVFSYNNLFGEPERRQLSELHQNLKLAVDVPLAGITIISALVLVGFALWIHRRDRGSTSARPHRTLSPLAAAALHQGRVDDIVLTGSMLTLIREGALYPGSLERDPLMIAPEAQSRVSDPYARNVLDILERHADSTGTIPPAVMRRFADVASPAQSALEDDLARHELFNPFGRVETTWLVLASTLVGAIALFTLLPSILGMSRIGVFAIVFAAICIAGVVTWAVRRSWTTSRGETALREWIEDAGTDDRIAYDLVINQDAIIDSSGGPVVPDVVIMLRQLRGLGAA